MIDQHVAEEKFYYEGFKEQYKRTKPNVQKLLKSEVIEFSQSEMILYLENVKFIKKLGFG